MKWGINPLFDHVGFSIFGPGNGEDFYLAAHVLQITPPSLQLQYTSIIQLTAVPRNYVGPPRNEVQFRIWREPDPPEDYGALIEAISLFFR